MLAGGHVIASRNLFLPGASQVSRWDLVGQYDELGRARAAMVLDCQASWPPSAQACAGDAAGPGTIAGNYYSAPDTILDAGEVVAQINTRLGSPALITAPNHDRVRAAVWRQFDRTIVHLVNYDVLRGAEAADPVAEKPAIPVRIPLPLGSPAAITVRSYAPELAAPVQQTVPLQCSATRCWVDVTIDVNVYKILEAR